MASASDLVGKMLGIMVKEGQEEVAPVQAEVSRRAGGMATAFLATTAAANASLNTRCVAAVSAFLACEEKQLATKYPNWRPLAGASSTPSFEAAVRTVRNELGVHLKLSKLCIALRIRYLLPKINACLEAYRTRHEECVRPAHRDPYKNAGAAMSQLVFAAVLQLVAIRNAAVVKADMPAWQARLRMLTGVTEDRQRRMINVVVQLCGDLVYKDPKKVPHVEDIKFARELLDNLDPAKVEELKEFTNSRTGSSVIEDAHMVAKKKRKHDKWRAQVLDGQNYPTGKRQATASERTVVDDVCKIEATKAAPRRAFAVKDGEDPMGWGGMLLPNNTSSAATSTTLSHSSFSSTTNMPRAVRDTPLPMTIPHDGSVSDDDDDQETTAGAGTGTAGEKPERHRGQVAEGAAMRERLVAAALKRHSVTSTIDDVDRGSGGSNAGDGNSRAGGTNIPATPVMGAVASRKHVVKTTPSTKTPRGSKPAKSKQLGMAMFLNSKKPARPLHQTKQNKDSCAI